MNEPKITWTNVGLATMTGQWYDGRFNYCIYCTRQPDGTYKHGDSVLRRTGDNGGVAMPADAHYFDFMRQLLADLNTDLKVT